MIKKYLLPVIPLLIIQASCAVDKATEAQLENAIETAAKQPATAAASNSGSQIYYDIKSSQWRSSDGLVCATCTPQNGFDKPTVQDNDLYYDPEIKKWRQSSMKGEICHTCTPQNGFAIPPTKSTTSGDMTLPEQRGKWCKNEVVGRFDTFMADVSIVREEGDKIYWTVNSTSQTGHCLFDAKNKFVKIVEQRQSKSFKKAGEIYWSVLGNSWVDPDGGLCGTCTPENGFPTPPKMQDGFFYLPGESQWFDTDGSLCATCTPENGFPISATTNTIAWPADTDASGLIDCSAENASVEQTCAFKVKRSTNGTTGTTVWIVKPGSKSALRVLYFNNSTFTTDDGAPVSTVTGSNNWQLKVGGNEFYGIPDALIFGG